MSWHPPIEYPEWVYKVREGDVLKWPNGTMRPIRLLHNHAGRDTNLSRARAIYCYFVIKHCSWTHRPYTIYTVGELYCLGVRPTGVNVRFKDELSKRLVCEMEESRAWTHGRGKDLTCCAVRGLP